MSVLQSTGRMAPKSVLRYRPIESVSAEQGTKTSTVDVAGPGTHAPIARASRVLSDGDEWQQRGARAVRPLKKVSATAQPGRLPEGPPRIVQRLLAHSTHTQTGSLFYIGIGMMVMVLCWAALSTITSWYSAWHDDVLYGMPRTFQTDARVGHNEQGGTASHFIAQNLHGRILVIEMPGGDVTKAHVYTGPQLYGKDDDLIPVTLQFQDVNHDGRPDMIVEFKDTRLIYVNDGTGFRPALAADDGLQILSVQ